MSGISRHAFGAVVAAGLVAGCQFAPTYHVPEVSTPPFKEQGAPPSDQMPEAVASPSWWRVFGDAELDRIEAEVRSANQDLKAAEARLRESRALAAAAHADLLPSVDAGGQVDDGRISQATTNHLSHARYHDGGVGLDLSYEVDVWGRVRDEADAAKDRAKASAADHATAVLSLQAETARNYFILRGLDAQASILDGLVADQAEALTLTQARFHAGYANEPEVDEAQNELGLAQTRAAEVRLQRAKMEHAIAILAGQPPASFAIAASPIAADPPTIAPALPADVLRLRPDVAAAERRVAAANRDIGVARAAFLPKFSLQGFIGSQSSTSLPLFAGPAAAWNVGASGLLSLFDGGRRRAASRQAVASFDEAVANYRQTVLIAYKEVEDELVANRRLSEEWDTQSAAVTAAEARVRQAQLRHDAGYVNAYEELNARDIKREAELALVQIRSRRMAAAILLLKALGGDWPTSPPPSAMASLPRADGADAPHGTAVRE